MEGILLIALGGLPATGKTTVARVLAQRLGATHLRIDTIEQALRRSGRLADDVGSAGYEVAFALAEDNLRLGGSVIADSVNPLKITRDAWRGVAERTGVPLAEVEIIRSNAEDHRRHVETRAADIQGLRLPTWVEVADREYEPWDRPHVVIDTSGKSVEECAEEILAALQAA